MRIGFLVKAIRDQYDMLIVEANQSFPIINKYRILTITADDFAKIIGNAAYEVARPSRYVEADSHESL